MNKYHSFQTKISFSTNSLFKKKVEFMKRINFILLKSLKDDLC